MKSNMSAVKFDTGDMQREPICILCSNVTTQGSRLLIDKNESTIYKNSASKLLTVYRPVGNVSSRPISLRLTLHTRANLASES